MNNSESNGETDVEWFSINGRETQDAEKVTVKSGGSVSFTAPFPETGPTVLYLKRVGH